MQVADAAAAHCRQVMLAGQHSTRAHHPVLLVFPMRSTTRSEVPTRRLFASRRMAPHVMLHHACLVPCPSSPAGLWNHSRIRSISSQLRSATRDLFEPDRSSRPSTPSGTAWSAIVPAKNLPLAHEYRLGKVDAGCSSSLFCPRGSTSLWEHACLAIARSRPPSAVGRYCPCPLPRGAWTKSRENFSGALLVLAWEARRRLFSGTRLCGIAGTMLPGRRSTTGSTRSRVVPHEAPLSR